MARLGERGEKTFWADSAGDFFRGSSLKENNFVGVVEGPNGSAILQWRLSGKYVPRDLVSITYPDKLLLDLQN